ncbi:cupin domain-containing protein [Chroococcidiopsis cubana]|uniref:cupin domain-containing protein n=1 Tax=Chroococcidiopsis cubana TaxID=171392 RepID=UPI002158DB49|nr:cupin domain-containing protein [Chroococcidiopsis cubana]
MLSRQQLPTVGFNRVEILKGATLKPHTHTASESFIYLLEGTAIVTLNEKNFGVKAEDTIYIPAGASHGFSTPDEAVVLLSVQSPPIYPESSLPDIHFGNPNSLGEMN